MSIPRCWPAAYGCARSNEKNVSTRPPPPLPDPLRRLATARRRAIGAHARERRRRGRQSRRRLERDYRPLPRLQLVPQRGQRRLPPREVADELVALRLEAGGDQRGL